MTNLVDCVGLEAHDVAVGQKHESAVGVERVVQRAAGLRHAGGLHLHELPRDQVSDHLVHLVAGGHDPRGDASLGHVEVGCGDGLQPLRLGSVVVDVPDRVQVGVDLVDGPGEARVRLDEGTEMWLPLARLALQVGQDGVGELRGELLRVLRVGAGDLGVLVVAGAPKADCVQEVGVVADPLALLEHQLAVGSAQVEGAAVADAHLGAREVPQRLELWLLPGNGMHGVLEEVDATVARLLEGGPDHELQQGPVLVLQRGQQLRLVPEVDGVVVEAPLRAREAEDDQ